MDTLNQLIKKNSTYLKYLLVGITSGVVISLLFVIFLLRESEFPISIFGASLLVKQYSILNIFYFFPIVLGCIFFQYSKVYYKEKNNLNKIISVEKKRNESITEFVNKIRKGNFDDSYQLQDENDSLGKTILELRNNLIKNKEEEERRHKEDSQRNWITEGLAKYSDILRQSNNNLEELSYSIISNLVKYMNINQGGFFIVKDDEQHKYFEQIACYAYNRKKYCEKRIEWSEGLIGACAIEKESIFMTDVPNGYLSITSGIGEATPRCVFIVPLKMNDEVHGVIELASFKVLEPFEINFVEKLAENIASTIYSVKSNLKTQKLLEQSQRQAEELSQQEEELRQNLEELRVTQEQIAIQSKEFEIFTHAVNHTMIRAEFNTEGKLTFANDKFIKKLSYTNQGEVFGKHVSVFINPKDQESFFTIWDNVIAAQNDYEGDLKFVTKQGKDIWTMTTIICIKGDMDSIDKIIFLAIDINEQKELNLDYEAQINALNRSSLKAQFLPDGMLVDCNDVFLETLQFETNEELKMKSIFDFLSKEDLESFKTTWTSALHGEPYKGQLKQYTKTKEEKWFQCTLTSVLNMYSEVVKIIYIANEITEQKQMEIATQSQSELLKKQEEQLRQSQEELSIKLEEVRSEMKQQFSEIEKIKIRNERTLEGAHDAIITFDKKGTIEFFNKAAETLWGYTREDILGKKTKMLFNPETVNTDPFIKELVDEFSMKSVGVRNETKIMKKSGEESSILILLSEARINDEHTYTAFIQNIEVELF